MDEAQVRALEEHQISQGCVPPFPPSPSCSPSLPPSSLARLVLTPRTQQPAVGPPDGRARRLAGPHRPAKQPQAPRQGQGVRPAFQHGAPRSLVLRSRACKLPARGALRNVCLSACAARRCSRTSRRCGASPLPSSSAPLARALLVLTCPSPAAQDRGTEGKGQEARQQGPLRVQDVCVGLVLVRRPVAASARPAQRTSRGWRLTLLILSPTVLRGDSVVLGASSLPLSCPSPAAARAV